MGKKRIGVDALPPPGWNRYRFTTKAEDCRPLVFNPSYPWWRSGFDLNDHAVIVAFLPAHEALATYWDDAENIDLEPCEGPTFTSRFPQPKWYVPMTETPWPIPNRIRRRLPTSFAEDMNEGEHVGAAGDGKDGER